jgi:hypothetical protein
VGIPRPWDRLDASKVTLIGVLEDAGVKPLNYLYNFGDSWEHTIKVERIFDGVPGVEVPFLLEASGRCPPEDIGGPWGYMEFLEAIADPNHERHDELTEWYGADFDPAVVDVPAIEAKLSVLAKRWSPRRLAMSLDRCCQPGRQSLLWPCNRRRGKSGTGYLDIEIKERRLRDLALRNYGLFIDVSQLFEASEPAFGQRIQGEISQL